MNIVYNQTVQLNDYLILEESEIWCVSDLYDALGDVFCDSVPFKEFMDCVFRGTLHLLDCNGKEVDISFSIDSIDPVAMEYSEVQIIYIDQ